MFNPWHPLIAADTATRWQRRGIAVSGWTVDDPTRRAWLRAAGVAAMITNELGCALRERAAPAAD